MEEGRHFHIRDGFCREDGSPNDDLPGTSMEVRFESTPAGSRFVALSRFPSAEALEALLSMGMMEGMRAAMGQLDAVLADLRDFSRSAPVALELVDDTHVRIERGGPRDHSSGLARPSRR